MWSFVSEIILSPQIFRCMDVYRDLNSTHLYTFTLSTLFKLSGMEQSRAFVNVFVQRALSFFLDIYVGVVLLGPKVIMFYLLRNCQTLFQRSSVIGNWISELWVFVLGKTLRSSIKKWPACTLCITKYVSSPSAVALHNLPSSFPKNMSCLSQIVSLLNKHVLSYMKVLEIFLLIKRPLTSEFGGRFFFLIVFRTQLGCIILFFPMP